MSKLISFKEFVKKQNEEFLKNQISMSESLNDVQSLFDKIELKEIKGNKNGAMYHLSVVTKKGNSFDFKIGLSELMSTMFINSLIKFSNQ